VIYPADYLSINLRISPFLTLGFSVTLEAAEDKYQIMKTKIAITVALCALFVAVPSATPKGSKPGPAGVAWSVICNVGTCSVGITGLSPGPGVSYWLAVADNCGAPISGSGFNADSTGAYHTSIDVSSEDTVPGCATTSWHFTVSTTGRHSSTVSSTTANDTN
jgi:hypothetical protein